MPVIEAVSKADMRRDWKLICLVAETHRFYIQFELQRPSLVIDRYYRT